MKDNLKAALEGAKEALTPPSDAAGGHELSNAFKEAIDGAKNALRPPDEHGTSAGLPGVATPDQTRTDGMIPDPGLSHADTAGLVEDRKRKGNLEGM